MKENKQSLIDRWKNPDWVVLYNRIIKALKKGKKLENIPNIPFYNNRIDLRGISFPKERTQYFYKGKNINQVTGSLKLRRLSLKNIDLTYADIQQSKWKNCNFQDIVFKHTNCEQLECLNCGFENVVFENTRLSYSYLNIRTGKQSGFFINVRFIKSLLNETRFSFPVFKDCYFENCNFYAADFDGSRFENTIFKGKINSPWFRKHSKNEYEPNILLNQVDKTKYTNEMKNIDFTKSQLEYVDFSIDLDLSNCKFPETIKFEKLAQLKDSIIGHL